MFCPIMRLTDYPVKQIIIIVSIRDRDKQMDIELIRTFLEVKDCRHFGKAAENLYLTQAAVSTRVRQLERYFGVTLFHRARNNIQLTIAGERLVPHAENMINTLRMAKQDVALASEQVTQISIAGTANTWDVYIHDAISKIYLNQPHISLIAEILSREQLTRKLLERTLDVAILFDPPKVEELKIESLKMFNLVPVTTFHDEILSPADVKRYIMIDWGMSFINWHAKEVVGISIPAIRTSTARIALDLMLQCGGSAYLPDMLIKPFIEQGKLFEIKSLPVFERELFSAFHKNNENEERILEIKNLLRKDESEDAANITLQ
jgi:DNA-binding transcriptional LysR family regulator